MKIPLVPPETAGCSRRINVSDVRRPHGEAACILAGLEQQREELGPIAEELIALLRHLGVGRPPPRTITPSSE